ncbi:MAG: exosortase A [Telluria sp.]
MSTLARLPASTGDRTDAAAARACTLVGAAVALPVLVHAPTVAAIVHVWNRSGTYAHGYAIAPIAAFLLWRGRYELTACRWGARPAALAPLAAAGAIWLGADLAGLPSLSEYALYASVLCCVVLLCGPHVFRAARFPLLFLAFAVPFGEVLVAPLISLTADITVWLLQASGVPVLREGNQLTLPTGSWSVIEACSGVRYLISSVTLGVLFAHECFRSRGRQAAFVAVSAVVPLFANAFRAFGIVMLGHLAGMRAAAGIDHLIYGWVFFGIVMFVVFAVGARWREAPPQAPRRVRCEFPPLPAWPVVAGAVAGVAMWPLIGALAAAPTAGQPAPRLQALAVGLPGAPEFTSWTPSFAQPAALVRRAYLAGGRPAGLLVLAYRGEKVSGARLVTSTNRLADEATGWVQVSAERRATADGPVNESVLQHGDQRLLVWSWYWIGGHRAAAPPLAKLYQVRQQLLSGRDDGAFVAAFADVSDHPAAARAAVAALAGMAARPLDSLLSKELRP